MKWISTQELAELLREFPGQPVEARPLHAGPDRANCVWRFSPDGETSSSDPATDARTFERTLHGTVERFTQEELRRAFPDEWWKVKPFFTLRGERERRLALRLVEELITLGLLDEVIDHYGIEDLRLCAHCHQPMDEGWLVDEATPYCTDECLLADHPDIDLAAAADDPDCSVYWTAWEG